MKGDIDKGFFIGLQRLFGPFEFKIACFAFHLCNDKGGIAGVFNFELVLWLISQTNGAIIIYAVFIYKSYGCHGLSMRIYAKNTCEEYE